MAGDPLVQRLSFSLAELKSLLGIVPRKFRARFRDAVRAEESRLEDRKKYLREYMAGYRKRKKATTAKGTKR